MTASGSPVKKAEISLGEKRTGYAQTTPTLFAQCTKVMHTDRTHPTVECALGNSTLTLTYKVGSKQTTPRESVLHQTRSVNYR